MNGKKKIPMRKCVGCGEMKSQKRTAQSSQDRRRMNLFWIRPERKNGRGAYVCVSQRMFWKGSKK